MNKGFTLIELLIAMAILSILAVIGVPQYMGYADTSRVTNVKNNLRSVYLQQQQYYQENAAYYNTGVACGDDATDINTNLFNGQTIIDDDHFTYCITQTTVDDFTATATEVDGDGRTFSIDELNQTTNF